MRLPYVSYRKLYVTARGLALAVLVLAAGSCSNAPPPAPTPAGTSATPAAQPSHTPTPVPATGPGSACEDADLRTFLGEVARHSGANGLSADAPVSRWLAFLLDAAPGAVEPTLQHIQQSVAAAEGYVSARKGSAKASVHARRLVAAAAGLAKACGLEDAYDIPAPGEGEASPAPS
ncbi:hypothetical protein Plo01_67350 [Planobispora longispora]|uniref:Lipoprotein n=1 Tax=Planobispora longispora TaxID=28887 RepID=A0A8J3RP88_9ACTN|nr:hypothetical protein Plo01_67350 [Planobispora longispora]